MMLYWIPIIAQTTLSDVPLVETGGALAIFMGIFYFVLRYFMKRQDEQDKRSSDREKEVFDALLDIHRSTLSTIGANTLVTQELVSASKEQTRATEILVRKIDDLDIPAAQK